jgi:DNA mismatch endonuclease (patch repair protein)
MRRDGVPSFVKTRPSSLALVNPRIETATSKPSDDGRSPPDGRRVSWATTAAVRRSMLGNRSRDTRPERLLRSELHRRGLRFRVDARPEGSIPRRADVIFRGVRLAIFVDGCFWHGCPRHYRAPATNSEYWEQKILGNIARDGDTCERLEAAGWKTLRFWEHEPVASSADRIAEVIVARR